MTADSARPSCTRHCIYSGLIAAVDMNVAVALIFTAGGAGEKKDKAAVTSEGTVSPLDTAVDIKDTLNGVKPVEEVPATTTTTLLLPPPPGRHQPRAGVHSGKSSGW